MKEILHRQYLESREIKQYHIWCFAGREAAFTAADGFGIYIMLLT